MVQGGNEVHMRKLLRSSELHPGPLLVAQGLQARHRVFAQAFHRVVGVDVALALPQAVQEQGVVGLHVLDCLEGVFLEPLADPSDDRLVQEEVREVGWLRSCLGPGERAEAPTLDT